VRCTRCPRLVAHRQAVALHPPARYAGQRYWSRPLPGWGAVDARILIVGLAPAAHGGNRTGRIFTGDRSGDFLFAALDRAGMATRPVSERPGDGTDLIGVYIAAVNRCAPPDNKPTTEERDQCLPYLVRELELLTDMRAIVALGAYAWDGVLRALAIRGHRVRPRPAFAHGAAVRVGPYVLVGSFHPSQQNTFTRRLTPAMLDAVLETARRSAGMSRG
jgi:uracil-DNA glycosylase family 4